MAAVVAQALVPFQPPLGPQPANTIYYSPNQVVLCMKEKVWSLSGDDFTVKTVDGHDILKASTRCSQQVKGKLISIHGKKTFSDMRGNELFTLSEKKLKLFKSFHAEAPGAHNFEVKGHFSVGRSRSTVEFINNADRRAMELEVKGDWLDRSATITLADRVVAQISRSLINVREVIGDKQTYFVTVAPGVDMSLIAAVCVCLDERENE